MTLSKQTRTCPQNGVAGIKNNSCNKLSVCKVGIGFLKNGVQESDVITLPERSE